MAARLSDLSRTRRIARLSSAIMFPFILGLVTLQGAQAQIIAATNVSDSSERPADPIVMSSPMHDASDPISTTPEPGLDWKLAPIAPHQGPLPGPPQPDATPIALDERRYASFGSQMSTVKWEVAGLAAYLTAINAGKVIKDPQSFRFHNEGWFGKSTSNVGVDKFTHAYNSYLIAEFLHTRINRRTGGASGGALTAALLASGLMIYSELYDAHEATSGFSMQDIIANTAGAGFSLLRNTVPGLKEKLDFRLLLIPNSDIYTFQGKRHFAQQRFLFALKLSGFEKLENSPLRFVELHAGYYARGFTAQDRARGEEPQRKPFVGAGLNLRELFFKNPSSGLGRTAGGALEYLQIPYTAIHVD